MPYNHTFQPYSFGTLIHGLLITSAVTFMTATLANTAIAQDDDKNWKADAEVGFVLTGGNTNTSSLNAKLGYEHTVNRTTYHGKYETLKTEENDTETADRLLLETGAKWQAGEKHYFFLSLLHEDDQFSQFDFQTTLATGYGRQLFANDQHNLDVSIGPGIRYSKFNTPVNGEDDDQEGLIRVAGKYLNNLSETATFTQNITVDSGEEQVISKSETALKAQIAGKLAMKTAFLLRHNSEPLAGDANSDRETSITLVYSW